MNYNNTIYYLRRDHQGSITGLVNGSGVLVEEYSFDAWGSRRSPSNWANYTVSTPTYLYRGYTFHEHLDQFDLINMNGRAYDPVVGRFLSVDPVIQNRANTQNYNRYSYCLNNPLKYTDPSGYRWTGTDQENHNGNLARQASLRQIKNDLDNWRTNQILGSVKIVGCAMHKPVGNNTDGDGVRLGSDLIAQMITVISQNCVVLKGLFGGGNSPNSIGSDVSKSDETDIYVTKITNNSGESAFGKPESDDAKITGASWIIPAGESRYMNIDGISTKLYTDKVFKIYDSLFDYDIVVNEDGSISLSNGAYGKWLTWEELKDEVRDGSYPANWENIYESARTGTFNVTQWWNMPDWWGKEN